MKLNLKHYVLKLIPNLGTIKQMLFHSQNLSFYQNEPCLVLPLIVGNYI